MVEVYTDGGCRPTNPGPGGYGVVAFNKDNQIIHYFNAQTSNTTNNREEIKAIIYACKWFLKNNEYGVIYSDSAYAVNICNSWIWSWYNNNWLKANQKEVENKDLMIELYQLLEQNRFNFSFEKVKGHSAVSGNEIADCLSRGGDEEEFKKLLKKFKITVLSEDVMAQN